MEKYTPAYICVNFRYGEKTDLYRVQFLLFLVASLDTPFHILHNDSSAAAVYEDAAEGISELARLSQIEGERQHGEQLWGGRLRLLQ
jgi:hypothetical protein